MKALKIATFNINGIRSRLPALLAWLEREQPDIACLQELKAANQRFPREAIEAAGYGCLYQGQPSWNGVAILARDSEPLEVRRGLPGMQDDQQSRYLEAAVHGVLVGCLYLPNGNPQPGPKFDYKLRWFECLIKHAQTLHVSSHPTVLAGDFNVVPTDLDIYSPRSWLKDALLQPESRSCFEVLMAQAGWMLFVTCIPSSAFTRSGTIFAITGRVMPGFVSITCCSTRVSALSEGGGRGCWVRNEAKASDHAPVWIQLGGRRQQR